MSRGRHPGWLTDLLAWRPENWIQAHAWPLFWNCHSADHHPLVGLGFYFSEEESWSGVVGFLIIVPRAILWVWLDLWTSPGLESEDLAHVRALPVTLGRTQYSWTRVFICISRDNYPFMQEINTLDKKWKEWNLVCASGNSQPRNRSRHINKFLQKSLTITLPTKVHLAKAMVFPVVMYVCESWTIKKAECWRTDAFELWCWRRLLRVPWTAKRSKQTILKEISLWTEVCDIVQETVIKTIPMEKKC